MPKWLKDMTVDEIAQSLLEDMEMLSCGDWEPDDHSIGAHCDLVRELRRRAKIAEKES